MRADITQGVHKSKMGFDDDDDEEEEIDLENVEPDPSLLAKNVERGYFMQFYWIQQSNLTG